MVESSWKVFSNDGKLALSSKRNQLFVDINEIAFVKCYGNYCKIQLANEDETNSYLFRTSVKNLAEDINEDNLIRISRSYIINVDCIDEVTFSTVRIKNENISVSRKFMNSLMKKMTII